MTHLDLGLAAADGDEPGVVWRSAKELAETFACDICTGVLIEPLTAIECMHRFCRECITGFLEPGQPAACPVCRVQGMTTSFGKEPLKDQLRVDFSLANILRKLSGQLASVALSREARVAQWQALSQAMAAQASAAAEPHAKPLKQLPPDGAGCVELYVQAPEGDELEQPYVRLQEDMRISLLTRFLRDRFRDQGGRDKDKLALRLECRGEPLDAGMRLGEVQARLWAPHAVCGQLLQIVVHFQSGEEREAAPS